MGELTRSQRMDAFLRQVVVESAPVLIAHSLGMPAESVVLVARCPEHGLHGLRTSCFACDGSVEQVPMVVLTDRVREALREAENA